MIYITIYIIVRQHLQLLKTTTFSVEKKLDFLVTATQYFPGSLCSALHKMYNFFVFPFNLDKMLFTSVLQISLMSVKVSIIVA